MNHGEAVDTAAAPMLRQLTVEGDEIVAVDRGWTDVARAVAEADHQVAVASSAEVTWKRALLPGAAGIAFRHDVKLACLTDRRHLTGGAVRAAMYAGTLTAVVTRRRIRPATAVAAAYLSLPVVRAVRSGNWTAVPVIVAPSVGGVAAAWAAGVLRGLAARARAGQRFWDTTDGDETR